jgi:hypothetical protein
LQKNIYPCRKQSARSRLRWPIALSINRLRRGAQQRFLAAATINPGGGGRDSLTLAAIIRGHSLELSLPRPRPPADKPARRFTLPRDAVLANALSRPLYLRRPRPPIGSRGCSDGGNGQKMGLYLFLRGSRRVGSWVSVRKILAALRHSSFYLQPRSSPPSSYKTRPPVGPY